MKRLVATLLILTLFLVSTTFAQDAAYLDVTLTDISRLPIVELTVQGQDGDGQPIDFDNEFIIIQHDQTLIDGAGSVQVVGSRKIGTFALFLLDLTPGVQPRMGEIASSVRQYASPDFMEEQIDSIAVFQADEVGAVERQARTVFHNDITNLFSIGVSPAGGATALYDSIGDLLARVDQLKPTATTPTHLIVYSDGTDAISTQTTPDLIISQAQSKNIVIDTVWLDNEDLTFSAEDGRNFMQQLAQETGGVFASLSESAELSAVWNQIGTGGQQAVLRYIVPELKAGTVNVEVRLPNLPNIPIATTTISIPDGLPTAELLIPVESREFTLSSVDEPINMRVPAQVTWLDEQVRGIAQAQIWHNGIPVVDVAGDEINEIIAELPLNFGDNTLKLVVVDAEGRQAQSQEVVLSVTEGENALPDELRVGGSIPWRLLGYILLCLIIIGLLLYIYFYVLPNWRKVSGVRDRVAERMKPVASTVVDSEPSLTEQRAKVEAPTVAVATEAAVDNTRYMPPAGQPTLEILDSLSKMPASVIVNRSEYLIGRSSTVDLAFTDDPTVSRIHATIVQDDKIYRIYDEQSTSGTYVNDKQVPEYGLQLANGDEIHMGAVHMRFKQ